MISTESRTPKNEEINLNLSNINFLSILKNGIFQEI